jgi:hypothetical protein
VKLIKYINTDTDIFSGLFKSQVQILKQFCPDHVDFECINVRNLFGKSKRGNIFEMTGWPMRYSNKILWLFPLIVSAFILALRLKREKPACIYVGRGYYGGLIGWFLNILGENFIWDPRSIYPLEELGAGKFHKKSLVFLLWLWFEKKIVSRSLGIIVVSEGHGKYYRRFTQRGLKNKVSIAVVPCYALPQNEQQEGYALDQAMFLSSDLAVGAPIVVYSGSLDEKWNKLSIYLPCFRDLILSGNNLIVMTQSSVKNQILEYLSKACSIPISALNSRICIANVADAKVQSAVLSQSDCGVMLMERVPDWYSRLSVKFANYRCAGLPVLVSRYFGGAISLLKNSDKSSYTIFDSRELVKIVALSPSQRAILREQSCALFSPVNFYLAVESFKAHKP